MSELLAGWRFVSHRLLSNWRLLLVTASGVIVAATLLAASPIYSSAMADLGLRFRLARALEDEPLHWVAADGLALGTPAGIAGRQAIDAIFEARAGWLYDERLVEERSSRIPLLRFPQYATETADGAAPVREQWAAFLFWLSGYEQRVTVIEGRLPGPPDAGAEVVLLDGFQRHAAVGDVVAFAVDAFDDCERIPPSRDPGERRVEVRCEPTAAATHDVRATIVGFVRPIDPQDPRWKIFRGELEAPERPLYMGPLALLDEQGLGLALAGVGSMPLFTSQEQLFGPFAEAMPEFTARHRVGMFPGIAEFSAADVERGIAEPAALRSDIESRLGRPVASWFPLVPALEEFRISFTFTQVPLLLILLQVLGIVLYYLVIVSSMLVERQAEEISVYRSRGASTAQLLGLYLMESVVIAVPAAVAAPWIAGRAVAALGLTPTFHAVTGGDPLPVAVTADAYLLAGAGALLAMLAMLLPALAVARRGIVDTKLEQARPPRRSVLQRYYLDVAAVGLAGFLLWQLSQRGTVFNADAVGGWSSDPLLLLSPLVLTVAVAALFLRLYPPLLRWAVRLLVATRGTAAAIGLRRGARSPAAYARLILLLIMAISVGTFAASYGPTVDRSHADRVRYETGSDLRARLTAPGDPALDEQVEAVRATPGVRDAVLVRRGPIAGLRGERVQLLGIDAQRASAVVWFRDDFAEESLASLMRRLRGALPSTGGLPLDPGEASVRISVYSGGAGGEHFTIWARLLDGAGKYHSIELGHARAPGWHRLEAFLPAGLARPVAFAGLLVTDERTRSVGLPGSLYFDDLTAVSGSGEERLLDDFEGPFGWIMYRRRIADERFQRSDDQSRSGGFSAKWTWPVGSSPGRRVLAVAGPEVPLAALVSIRAAEALGVGPGDRVEVELGDFVAPVSVRVVVDLFPTMDPEAGFMVVNYAHLLPLAALLGVPDARWDSELWVRFDAPVAQQAELVETLTADGSPIAVVSNAMHLESQLNEVRSDPTVRASGSGILIAAFIAVLALSALGFLMTLVFEARNRTLEFAVLRAMGSSRLQMLGAMVLEWSAVLAIGAAIGVLLGRRVARVMLSFLDITESGSRVLPPFVLLTDWQTLALGLGILSALVTTGLAVSWRSALQRGMAAELRVTR